jgi:hypothetical protein
LLEFVSIVSRFLITGPATGHAFTFRSDDDPAT